MGTIMGRRLDARTHKLKMLHHRSANWSDRQNGPLQKQMHKIETEELKMGEKLTLEPEKTATDTSKEEM